MIEEEFHLIQILLNKNLIGMIKKFSKQDLGLSIRAINLLSNTKNKKEALRLVHELNLNPFDFPDLIGLIYRSALSYYLSASDICIRQILDIVIFDPKMVHMLIKLLLSETDPNECLWKWRIAKTISENFSFLPLNQYETAKLKSVVSWKLNNNADLFAPLQPEYELLLPLSRNSVVFVSNLSELNLIKIEGNYIGIDCEWKFPTTALESPKVSILQLAFEKIVYIIDLISLHTYPELNSLISTIFQSEIIKLGVSIQGDLNNLMKSYPNLTSFQTQIKNYFDVFDCFRIIKGFNPGGLAGICEDLLGKNLSKFEQKSNWELRPLRESQMHYAALDAYVLILIFKKILETGVTLEKLMKKNQTVLKTAENCKFCQSRLHDKTECARGKRCKICGRTGHEEKMCSF